MGVFKYSLFNLRVKDALGWERPSPRVAFEGGIMSLNILRATWNSACGHRDLSPRIIERGDRVEFLANDEAIVTIVSDRVDAPAAPGVIVAELVRYTAAKKAVNGTTR